MARLLRDYSRDISRNNYMTKIQPLTVGKTAVRGIFVFKVFQDNLWILKTDMKIQIY